VGAFEVKPKCLVVDNDAGVAQLAQAFFQRKGIEVSSCRTGEEAWGLLAGDEAWDELDLLLLDLRMPGMGGVGLLEKMVEREGGPKVIVMSGFVSEEDQAFLSKQDRVVGVLHKPFDLLELHALVLGVVKERRGGASEVRESPTLPFGEGGISMGGAN
jgi:DNA-binding response OmpR family regulator